MWQWLVDNIKAFVNRTIDAASGHELYCNRPGCHELGLKMVMFTVKSYVGHVNNTQIS